MGRIYNSAYLTIAASHAESDDSGFLAPRPKPSIEPVELQYCEKGSQCIKKWWFAVAGNLKGRAYDNIRQGIDHSTLNSRAWVLQERLLSPRVVHFTETQIIWVSFILKSITVIFTNHRERSAKRRRVARTAIYVVRISPDLVLGWKVSLAKYISQTIGETTSPSIFPCTGGWKS